jgi:hypothetical protein
MPDATAASQREGVVDPSWLTCHHNTGSSASASSDDSSAGDGDDSFLSHLGLALSHDHEWTPHVFSFESAPPPPAPARQ